MVNPLENLPYEDIVAIDRRLFSGRNPSVQAKVSDLENVLSQVSGFEDASNRNLRYLNRRINATNEAIFKLSEELNTGLATMATRIDSLTDPNPFHFPFPIPKQNKQNRSKSQTPSRQFPLNVDLNAQSSNSITPNLAQNSDIRNRGLTDSSTPPPLNQVIIEEEQQDDSHVWADESSDRINGLTFENQSSGGLNSFTGESSQTFESWSRKFMDYIEATGRRMEEGDKIGRLKMMLEGTPRDIFEDLPADRKATLQAAIHALKTVLDTPFKSQLAKQSLASCRQKEGEMVETFVERLIPLVNAAYQELDPKFRKDMLKSAFLEKLRDEISFHVRLGSSASQTFEETRIKALEVENLLATRKPRVDPDWINVMSSSSSARSPPNLLQGNFTTWQPPPPQQKRVSFGPSQSANPNPNNYTNQFRPPSPPRFQNRNWQQTPNQTPTCYYCKKPGHVISECRILAYKNQNRNSQNWTSQPPMFTHSNPNSIPISRPPPYNSGRGNQPHQRGTWRNQQSFHHDQRGAWRNQQPFHHDNRNWNRYPNPNQPYGRGRQINSLNTYDSLPPDSFQNLSMSDNGPHPSFNTLTFSDQVQQPVTASPSQIKEQLVCSGSADKQPNLTDALKSEPKPVSPTPIVTNWESHPRSSNFSIAPFLTRFNFILCIITLSLSASLVSSSHSQSSLKVLPMVCQTHVEGTIWSLPIWLPCPKLKHTPSDTPIKQPIRLFQPNPFEQKSKAWVCRKVKKSLIEYTNPWNDLIIKQLPSENLPVLLDECKQMVQEKSCSEGILIQSGELLFSNNPISYEKRYPFLGWSWKAHNSTNCFAFQTEIFVHHSEDHIRTSLGHPNCKYTAGNCRLDDNSILMWLPSPKKLCQFINLGKFLGTFLSNIWVAEENDLALSFPQTKTLIEDCNQTLSLSYQNFAVQFLPTDQPRSKRSADSLVTTSQLASQLTFLDHEVKTSLIFQFSHSLTQLCNFIDENKHWTSSALLSNPTALARSIFSNPYLFAKQLTIDSIKIWPCVPINSSSYQFKATELQTCFDLLPIQFSTNSGPKSAFLNPISMIVTPEARTAPCSEYRNIPILINGSLIQVDQITGSVTPLKVNNLPLESNSLFEIPKIKTHAFHHLALTNLSDIISHSFAANIFQVSKLTYLIEFDDSKVKGVLSSDWKEVRDEMVKQITGDWSQLRDWFILIICALSAGDILIRILALILEKYFSNVSLVQTLFGLTANNSNQTRPPPPPPPPSPSNTCSVQSPNFSNHHVVLELGETSEGNPTQWPPSITRFSLLPKFESNNSPRLLNAMFPLNSKSFVTTIPAHADTIPLIALIDSAASSSIAPIKLKDKFICQNLNSSEVSITTAVGIPIPVTGSVPFSLHMANMLCSAHVHFAPDYLDIWDICDIIIGTETLERFPPILFDFHNKFLTFGYGPPTLFQSKSQNISDCQSSPSKNLPIYQNKVHFHPHIPSQINSSISPCILSQTCENSQHFNVPPPSSNFWADINPPSSLCHYCKKDKHHIAECPFVPKLSQPTIFRNSYKKSIMPTLLLLISLFPSVHASLSNENVNNFEQYFPISFISITFIFTLMVISIIIVLFIYPLQIFFPPGTPFRSFKKQVTQSPPFPVIQLKVNSVLINCKIDLKSDISFTHVRMACYQKSKFYSFPKPLCVGVSFLPLQTIGEISTNIEIASQTHSLKLLITEEDSWVSENNFDVVLGSDFLSKFPSILFDPLLFNIQIGDHNYPMISSNRDYIFTQYNPHKPKLDAIISASLNSVELRSLVDTGATLTAAPISLAETIGCSPRKTNLRAISASGHQIPIIAQAEAFLSIGTIKEKVLINFVDDSRFIRPDYALIIGCDSLACLPPVTFNFQNLTLSLANISVPMGKFSKLQSNIPIFALRSITLAPGSQTIVPIKITTLPKIRFAVIDSLNNRLTRDDLGWNPTLIEPINGISAIPISNPSQSPKTIFANMTIATANEVSEDPDLHFFYEDPDHALFSISPQSDEGIIPDPSFKIDFSKSSVSGPDLQNLKNLCEEFSDIFSKSQYDLGSSTAGAHEIVTSTQEPITCKPHRTPFKYRDELKKHIEQLLKSGVMVQSDTPWVSNIVLVQKKDGGLRPCIDFRKLNEITIPDHYPLPRLETIMEKIGHCHFYSSLDLSSGYFQIPLTKEASRKCGLIIEEGVFQMTHLPFGLRNATSAFARTMAHVLSGLDGFVVAYVDDILVFTKPPSFSDHLSALQTIFERFRRFNLKLSPKKCTFAASSMNFLGHTVSSKGYSPSLSRIEVIKNIPTPQNLKQVKRIVGMASFYRRHIPNFSTIVEPLTSLTKKEKKFIWDKAQEDALTRIKELLSQNPILTFPDYSQPFHIFTDASVVGQGAALMQKKNDLFSAVAYASRTLSAPERRWPPVQIELGAIVYALRTFKPYIYMSEIELHTDHRPLAYLQAKAQQHAHLARWLIELQNFNIKIVHISGKKNALADALSRLSESDPPQIPSDSQELQDIIEFPVCLSLVPFDRIVHNFDPILSSLTIRTKDGIPHKVDLFQEQRNDPQVLSHIKFLEDGSHPDLSEAELQKFLSESEHLVISSDILYFHPPNSYPRVFIPVSLRSLIFDSFHISILGGGHMSLKKTLQKCAKKYYWPKLHSDIFRWIKQCLVCQLRHNPIPMFRAEMKSVPSNTLFAKIGLDLAGPLPITEMGNRYILNFVCWFSKYVISVPVPDTKSLTTAKALLRHVYLKFGGCTELISDNATTFTSDFFKSFCSLLYINKSFSTPYWSQGNGATERTFRTFHNILSKYINPKEPNFDEFLDAATFCYNTSIHESTGESPFFLVFGRDPIFSIDQILDPSVHLPLPHNDLAEFKTLLVLSLRKAWNSAADSIKEAQNKSKVQYDKKFRNPNISIGDRVLLRNYTGKPGTSQKFHNPWKGVFRVINIEELHVTIVSCSSPQSNPFKVHINQLKKLFEISGPPSTSPVLSSAEKAALEAAEATEIPNTIGFNHTPDISPKTLPLDTQKSNVPQILPTSIDKEQAVFPQRDLLHKSKYNLRSRPRSNSFKQ